MDTTTECPFCGHTNTFGPAIGSGLGLKGDLSTTTECNNKRCRRLYRTNHRTGRSLPIVHDMPST
jgi:hypothetical protein